MTDQNANNHAVAGQPQNPVRGFVPSRKAFTFACVILACMISISAGYNVGAMTGAASLVKADLKITELEFEILVGFVVVLNPFIGWTSDRLGRRYTIIFASATFFAGALFMGLATNFALLITGRVISGVGVGYALMVAPVYAAELSPASTRGFLSSLPEVFINAGMLLAYISNYALSKLPPHLGWRFMLGVGAVPSVLSVVAAALGIPESPRWLVIQGRLSDARRVLNKTSNSDAQVRSRLAAIRAELGLESLDEEYTDDVDQMPKRPHGVAAWKQLILQPTPSVGRILIVAVGINFFQQSTGIGAVVLYGPTIFEKAGIKNENKKLLALVVIGLFKLAFTLIATFALDKIGRRPLLLGSVWGMILSLVGLGVGLTIIDHYDEKQTWATAMCIGTVLSYIASFSLGMGPITRVYTSEIFPLRLRAQGASMGLLVNTVTSGVLLMTFESLYKAITIGGVFFVYAAIAVVAWLFVYKFLPETQGRTLDEMERLFETL